ncbi:alpha-E domain-containing protein [Aestuariirhabdus litorea]|uniref:Alpha-E domain-containing protein n=1 Tax=Aestuariirhabdus litorea TaxID=2528527 RepID=A0A3P3VN13_9GAMM|nr:alpha-E domain-containing protein [Aestuariirhabdus litorea]RRJ84000.1 alpha-E domain-containing protein [Aestuariirhabdus litorea]RWW97220.1 alpha-E domain-containing protein [Endozoicomonadaceae bacterium GTF-13]
MLSRVAERVYWMGRYLERAENTARMISVYFHVQMDIPNETSLSWHHMLDIVGTDINQVLSRKPASPKAKSSGEQQAGVSLAQEKAVMKYLVSDARSPSSILSFLQQARENARTAREIIPSEAWELINNLYLYAKERAPRSLSRSARQKFLQHVIERTQQCAGLLSGTMSATPAYDFICLGRSLERADMTSRIVDVGARTLFEKQKTEKKILSPYVNVLWMSVLQSLSAYQMYRQHMMNRVNGESVVTFLLQDSRFPRSMTACLGSLKTYLSSLPNNEEALRALGAAQRRIDAIDVADSLATASLYESIDLVQLDLIGIHNEIANAWFLPSRASEPAEPEAVT